MPATFIGIDQSLRSPGFAVIGADGPQSLFLEAAKTGSRRGAERLAFIRNTLAHLLERYRPLYAALEGYSIESQNRPFDLGEVGGAVRLCLYDHGVPFVVVPPTSLKKFVTGNGQAKKDKVQEVIKQIWGLEIPQDDESDAYGLSHVARAFYLKTSTRRCELEVLKTLTQEREAPLVSRGRTKVSI